MLDAALAYVRAGWRVIPLCWPDELGTCGCGRSHDGSRVGKVPLIPWKGVTPNEAEVRDWWSRWPQANLGLLLEPSGVLVVDCDGPDAVQEAQRRGVGGAPCVESARGKHYLFRCPPEVRGRRATHCGDSQDIDVLAGGYTILPPSRHRSGATYRWLAGPSPLPEAPAWAVQWLAEPQAEVAVTLGELPTVTLDQLRIPEFYKHLIVQGLVAAPTKYASRSEATFAVVRALLKAGHSPEEIAAVLLNEEWAVGDKLREKPDPVEAARQEIGRCIAKTLTSPDDQDALRDLVVEGPALKKLLEARPLDWLIEDLVPTGALVVLGGHTKGGKTTLTFHLARAMREGIPWVGRKVKPGPAVYVNYEMPLPVVGKMLTDILGPDPAHWPPMVPVPTKPTDPGILKAYLHQAGRGPGVIILDSLSPALGLHGEAENLAGEVGPRVRALADLAHETGWVVLIIHHLRKLPVLSQAPSILDLAGSRELSAAADVIMLWHPKEDRTEPGTLFVTGRVPEQKLHVRLLYTLCELAPPPDPARKLVEAILYSLSGGVVMTQRELQELLIDEADRRLIQRTLARLVKEGVLGTSGPPGSAQRQYFLRQSDSGSTTAEEGPA